MLIGAAAVTVVAPATAALADPTPAQVQAQIDKGNSDVELIVEQYDKVNGDLTATQASLAALQSKLAPLQASMDAASANVNKIAVTAYQTGSSLQTWSLLLSDHSTDNFMDQVATLRQISQSQQHQIETYTATKKSFDAESKRLNDLLAAQTAQKADLVAKRTKIEGDIARLDALQKKLTAQAAAANRNTGNTKAPTTNPTPPTNYGPPPAVSGSAGKAVSYAWAQLNKRYVWGAAGPDAFDCSGLTMMAWRAAGVSLPHNAAEQYHAIKHISRSELVPGDLVFYNGLGHVGIYIGNNQMIAAPTEGEKVKIQSVGNPTLIRRVLPSATPSTGLAGASTLAGVPYANLFTSAASRYGIDPSLLAAVANQESSFNPSAVSPSGAQGLMQFMPSTAQGLGVNPLDPASSVDGAARYLSQLTQQFGSTDLALAAYNAGPGAVSKYGGIPPYPETQNYVSSVMTKAEAYG